MNVIEWLKDHNQFFSKELNGYSDIPFGPYLSTLPLIDRDGIIIDLGCGNGMLLKFLIKFSNHRLIPFGIDINEKSIKQASEKVLPDYSENFQIKDIRNYRFNEGPFDLIISNPFYVKPKMREFTEQCLENLNVGGRIIYRVHDDVLKTNKINNLDELPDFKNFRMKTARGSGLVFGIFDK